MAEQQPYRVLLYYLFTHIENPEEVTQEHLDFCKDLGLRGRILIAEEGINGTVSGTIEQTDAYMEAMKNDPRFKDIVFKIEESAEHAFKKMHVRYRSELVTLRMDEEEYVDPRERTAEHLTPKEFYEEMQRDDVVILDTRNTYEYDLGHFRGAVRPDIEAFRELPEWIENNKDMLEGKRVLTYCTGGIRCEKFTGWMQESGIENVAQLEGGIISYGQDEEVEGRLWDGQCYVFDQRISVPVNQVEHVVVGRDHFTGEPCERYVNCANPECDTQILASEESEYKYMRACCHDCRVHPRNRYIAAHELSNEEVERRLQVIEKEKQNEPVNT
ncbi:UPF0176 protein [Salsuginibacillus halophilus]|uniref:tRNA uridine(34) hydroxylase n=1 Tax=Salsuginibacillus halophilus TaxID=517424 RepID=A0A2P8HIC2_9BACI|nr:rhodanese-related sulfurtransferase [Salsuginibacillus halophilus]PSL45961.1 UPF0176 protein [Salsuginibacillus halophilus]